MEFKDLIRSLRIEAGKSLEDVARDVGVSRATVLRWESGEIKNMRRDKLISLAKSLHTTPIVLMGAAPYDPDATPTSDSVTAKLEAVLRSYGYLDPDERLTPELLDSISVALKTAIEIYRKSHK
jgi:transcriptional regulator with XRE-family HTH domain